MNRSGEVVGSGMGRLRTPETLQKLIRPRRGFFLITGSAGSPHEVESPSISDPSTVRP